jgi:release factor glutamine methyltransferase
LAEKISFVESDGFGGLTEDVQFDLLVSNPPYIPSSEIETLQEEVQKYDPRQALDGGVDGLDFYRVLAKEGAKHVKIGGKLLVEFGDGQENQISALFASEGWAIDGVLKDYTDRPRILKGSRS